MMQHALARNAQRQLTAFLDAQMNGARVFFKNLPPRLGVGPAARATLRVEGERRWVVFDKDPDCRVLPGALGGASVRPESQGDCSNRSGDQQCVEAVL
jgi:hypothetical protein